MSTRTVLTNLDRISRFMSGVAGIALVLMMLHVVADVTMKYVFNLPIPGTLEIVAFYYMVAAVFLPLAYIELHGLHITVDLIYDRMPPAFQRIALGFGLLCSIGFFSILTYQTWFDAVESFEIGEIAMGAVAVSLWPTRFFLPLGFGAIVIASMVRFVGEVLMQKSLYETEPEDQAVKDEYHG